MFDNLSKLDQDMSDWLCRLSEGAGLPKRKLFTDTEEILIEAARPIILTAIPDIAQSGDLIDRASVRCEPLPESSTSRCCWTSFDEFRPSAPRVSWSRPQRALCDGSATMPKARWPAPGRLGLLGRSRGAGARA